MYRCRHIYNLYNDNNDNCIHMISPAGLIAGHSFDLRWESPAKYLKFGAFVLINLLVLYTIRSHVHKLHNLPWS